MEEICIYICNTIMFAYFYTFFTHAELAVMSRSTYIPFKKFFKMGATLKDAVHKGKYRRNDPGRCN